MMLTPLNITTHFQCNLAFHQWNQEKPIKTHALQDNQAKHKKLSSPSSFQRKFLKPDWTLILIKILLFSLDAITLAFSLNEKNTTPFNPLFQTWTTPNETTKTLNKADSTRQQKRPIFLSKYSPKFYLQELSNDLHEGRERSERPSRCSC